MGCADFGFYGGQRGCQTDCMQLDLSRCTGYCGDRAINGPEECDGESLAAATCASLGYGGGGLPSCDAQCRLDTSPCCGDGVAGDSEACDGTDFAGQTCATIGQGFFGGQLTCTPHCEIDASQCNLCGDGVCSVEDDEDSETCKADCAVVDVSSSAEHTCAVLADGTVRCWGYNYFGALGVMIPQVLPANSTRHLRGPDAVLARYERV